MYVTKAVLMAPDKVDEVYEEHDKKVLMGLKGMYTQPSHRALECARYESSFVITDLSKVSLYYSLENGNTELVLDDGERVEIVEGFRAFNKAFKKWTDELPTDKA